MTEMSRRALILFALLAGFVTASCGRTTPAAPSPEPVPAAADRLFVNGRIYTAEESRRFVDAFAVSGDAIVYAGDEPGAAALKGPETDVIDLQGRLVLPGLHDAHIHPIGAMDVSTCDLKSEPMDLGALSAFVAACLAAAPASDGWFTVDLWSFSSGNQPTADFPTIRASLDAAAPDRPVILLGNDGHHYALNSAGLAEARNEKGEVVGFSAETLAEDFFDLAEYVGVDAAGEPDGRITEDYALAALGAENLLTVGLDARRARPERMMDVTLPRGITSFMDAAADPATLDIYDALLAKGAFKARATLALFFDPSLRRNAAGGPDLDGIMADATAIRDRYRDEPLIKADFLKVFADGVMEGDPLANPPTLPNAALSRPYLQPRFRWNEETQWVDLAGYVDPGSDLCAATRTAFADGAPPDVASFSAQHGFHPRQCLLSSGVLQHDRATLEGYVARGAAAGFRFHIHAIGDRAVAAALDALSAAQDERAAPVRDIITHLQLVRPEDISRFGADGPYASFTFAWVTRDPAYDTTVAPFIDRGDGPDGYYDETGYYWENSYPAGAILAAGGSVIAGSDAPVDTRDPRPFVNIEGAVRRSINELPAYNLNQALTIFDAVDAYTSRAAEALGTGDETGRIAPGYKADFIVLDQDIFSLAETGRATDISETSVLETWFGGAPAYRAP